MKKLLILLICISVCLLPSCNNIKEYKGEAISKITYVTIDYNGGYTQEHVIDLDLNTYDYVSYYPDGKTVFDAENDFDDEQEQIFLNACYSFGMFSLKESYSRDGVDDGGRWEFTIEYADGSTKKSIGVNERPDAVFEKCSTYFFDLCQKDVLGCLPAFYSYPPNVSWSSSSKDDPEFRISVVERADFKWNTASSEGNDIFEINEGVKSRNDLEPGAKYTFCLYTANYTYKEKFQKITVKEYDYNRELTGEREVYSGKWFKQIEFEVTTDKIYTYELTYKNGDFVIYTFNTACGPLLEE